MRIGIILIAILVPSVISLIYFLIGNRHMNLPKKETDENFVVSVPKIVMALGAMLCITIIILITVFSLTSKELPHPIFYGIMGMFLWMGVYLVIKVLRFRVVVKGKQITVYPLFHKTFTFQFEDIVSVTHQVKNNSAKSERVVVKISTGKKFVVESSEYGYKRFLKRIMETRGRFSD